jgi:hypothetical protein
MLANADDELLASKLLLEEMEPPFSKLLLEELPPSKDEELLAAKTRKVIICKSFIPLTGVNAYDVSA